MLDGVAVATHKRRTCAHADHNDVVFTRLIHGSQAVGHELVGLGGGQSVDRCLHISASYARHHDLLDVAEVDLVIVKVFSESAIKRCHRVGSRNADWRDDCSVTYSHNFCCADANVDSNDYSHVFDKGLKVFGCKFRQKTRKPLIPVHVFFE